MKKYLENFHYQITGNPSGHKLVFLHGLMGAANNWLRVVPAFQADFHVLVYDQRGHGRSFHPLEGYHPRDFAGDLKQILDELGWSEASLVGHSMGGRNALEFAAHFSQRVKTLVMEDIGPESNYASIENIERLLSLVPTPFPSRAAAGEFFANQYPGLISSFHSQPEVLAKFFLSNISEKPGGEWDWRFNKDGIFKSMREGRNEDRWDAFRNLKMPVMVVRGELSKDLTKPVFDKMLQVLPSAKGVEIANAGHWVHFDQNEAFVRALKEFFHSTLGTNL